MTNSSTTDSTPRCPSGGRAREHSEKGARSPRRDEALELLIGNWINEGVTIEAENPSVPIVTSDVYEWVPGRYFVIHSAYGMIGDTSVGGVEIIGVTGDGYSSAFYDSFGNTHSSRMEIVGHVITWTGERTRCTATITEGGSTQVAHHEVSIDGKTWTASMDVTLRKVK